MVETSPSLAAAARYSGEDLEPLRAALLAVSKGDFTQHSPAGTPTTLNDEVARVAREVGTGGRLGRAKSIASGASEYVIKPVDISQLIGLVRGWLERRPQPDGRPGTHPRTEGSG